MSGILAASPALAVSFQPSNSFIKVFDAVQAFGCNDDLSKYGTEAVENISNTEFDEIRTLKKPPPIVQRTLEATCLILDAAQAPACQEPPQWDQVKKRIARVDFTSEVLMYDLGSLRGAPLLVSFLCTEYFGAQSGPISASLRRQQRRSTNPQHVANREMLTYSRVRRANAATAALFMWCVRILEQVRGTTPEQEELPQPASPPAAKDPSPEPIDPPPADRDPSPEPVKTLDIAPDRHFEDEICFDEGKETVEEQKKHNDMIAKSLRSSGYDVIEPHGPARDWNDRAPGPSQGITAKLNAFVDAARLRRGLEIQLMPGDDQFAGTELMRMRLGSVLMFFVRSGVPCSVSDTRTASGISVRCPGNVICQLLIDGVLSRFFHARTKAVAKASCGAPVSSPWKLNALVQVSACLRLSDAPTQAALLTASRSHSCAHLAIQELKPSTEQEILRLAHEASFLEARFSTCMAEHSQS